MGEARQENQRGPLLGVPWESQMKPQNLVVRLRKIALRYGIKKVLQVREGDEHIAANGVEPYVNCAEICGREILLGDVS